MIIGVWRPRYKTSDDVKGVYCYELLESVEDIKTGFIVTYTCDYCKSNKVCQTTSSVLLNDKVTLNTLNNQTCRSCRSYISENDVKKSYIPHGTILETVTKDGYTLLTGEDEYMSSRKKSQCHLNVICDRGHDLKITWGNWSKGKRCLRCYKEKRFDDAVKYKNGWSRYQFLVWYYTQKSYTKYFTIINPNNLPRGKEYHLDHKYSIYEGFYFKQYFYDPNYI